MMKRDESAASGGTVPGADPEKENVDDAAILPPATGGKADPLADFAPEDRIGKQPIGAERRSAASGLQDAGTGANETADGLSPTEEDIREAAEDEADLDDFEEVPVFDRAETMPKII
jgi:hypothetical protein